MSFLWDEIMIVNMVSHPNIIEIKEVFETDKHVHIVMEEIENGDLSKHLSEKYLNIPSIAKLVYQILSALEYLQSCGIVHRDLKPSNILIQEKYCNDELKFNVKVIDFGFSTILLPN